MDAHGIMKVSHDLGEAGGGWEVCVRAVERGSVVGVAAGPAVVNLSDHS